MLALLEHQVTALGGHFAICDTDSMAIVAAPHPSREPAIPELSWEDVENIRRSFGALNPYDQSLIDSTLKVESENFDHGTQVQLWCYAISAKRYVLLARR